MKQYSDSKRHGTARAPLYQHHNPQPAAALETGLIFITSLLAVISALHILNGQIARLI